MQSLIVDCISLIRPLLYYHASLEYVTILNHSLCLELNMQMGWNLKLTLIELQVEKIFSQHDIPWGMLWASGQFVGGLQLLLSSLKHSSSLWGPNHPLMIACLESFLFTFSSEVPFLKQKIEIYLLLVTFVNFWLGLSLNPAYYFDVLADLEQITKCTILADWLYFHHHYFNIIVCAQHFLITSLMAAHLCVAYILAYFSIDAHAAICTCWHTYTILRIWSLLVHIWQ